MTEPTLPRRPALDGVRALAVAAVLLHHARVPGFAGGYLGVDVFFVLSGFLITSLLLGEVAASGRVDLRRFWARRARRLLPALFAVLLAVAAYAAWLAPATTRARLGGDALATLAYVANWRFVVDGTSYFEQYADPSPLLHTWSLAVEEQFYLVWPLLVGLAVVVARGRPLPRRPWVWAAVVAGVLGSAALAVVLTPAGADVGRAYYGTDVRAQELLAGALLALWAVRRSWWTPAAQAPATSGLAALAQELPGLAGLAALGVAVALAADSRPFLHDGGLLAVAVAAAALVAAAASPRPTVVRRALELPPLVALGVISYGVYLWHWPLFVVLTPDRTGLHGTALAVLRIVATIAVAAASYRLLERPVRRADLSRLDPATRVMLLPGAAVATLAAVAVATSVSAPPPQLGAPQPASAAASDGRVANGSGGVVAAGRRGRTPTRPLSVFVLGDSTAFGLHNEYPPPAASGLQVTGSTQLGCDLLGGGLVVNGQPQAVMPICAQWTGTWHQGVAQAHPDVAVLVTGNGFLFDRQLDGRLIRFGTPEYRSLLASFLDSTLDGLQASATRVVVTNLVCFAKTDTGLDDTPAVVNDVARQRSFNALLAELLRDHPKVRLLDLRAYTCPGDRYRAELDGVRLQVDGVHWTREGAALVWAWLRPRLAAAAS